VLNFVVSANEWHNNAKASLATRESRKGIPVLGEAIVKSSRGANAQRKSNNSE
jgi:hypothetical protein